MALIPGIPALSLGAATPAVATIASEAISLLLWQAAQVPPAWGVYDSSGNLVVQPDSVLEFDHRQEYEISDYPVQEGAFASYNKVIKPFEIQLRFSKGGTADDRSQFLTAIQTLVESIELYSVYTPEMMYQNCNLERYEVARRGAAGAYFLTEVDLFFRQIIPVSGQYTSTMPFYLGVSQLPNAQSEAAQPTTNVGTVLPQSVSSTIANLGGDATASVAPGTY